MAISTWPPCALHSTPAPMRRAGRVPPRAHTPFLIRPSTVHPH